MEREGQNGLLGGKGRAEWVARCGGKSNGLPSGERRVEWVARWGGKGRMGCLVGREGQNRLLGGSGRVEEWVSNWGW